MRFNRTLIPAAVMLALGVGVACNKPAPAPKVDEEAAKRVEMEAANKKAEEEARRKAVEEEARKQAEAEAVRRAEMEKAETVRKVETEKMAAFKSAAEAALKDINFAFDKSAIRETDKPKLQAVADFMKANPQAKLQLEGHCDERGTIEYNLALGEHRAHAAKSYLTNLGVAEERLSTISYGKERPKVQGKDEESWLINRRCEFKLQ